MEIVLQYHFTLNSFKSLKTISIICTNFQFSLAFGGSPAGPEAPITPRNELLDCGLRTDRRILGKKLKWQEENLGKISEIR